MEEFDDVWLGATGIEHPTAPLSGDAQSAHLQRAALEIERLSRCVELKERQVCELRKVLAHSATLHYAVEDRMQRELDALRVEMPGGSATPPIASSSPPASGAVVVQLPYMTSILSTLFEAMATFWSGCDPDRLPKSSTVAHAIDERLGLSAQANGEASRSGQAYASAIRPDWIKDADKRHHSGRAWRR